jgi:hypothetical protein
METIKLSAKVNHDMKIVNYYATRPPLSNKEYHETLSPAELWDYIVYTCDDIGFSYHPETHSQNPVAMRRSNMHAQDLRLLLEYAKPKGLNNEEYEILKETLLPKYGYIFRYPSLLEVVEEYYEKWQCDGGKTTKAANDTS